MTIPTKTKKSAAAKKPLVVKKTARKALPPEKKMKEEPKPAAYEAKLASVARAIDKAIDSIREKLTADDLRASVSDLVRLIQLRKELVDEGPKQVTVRWVEEWNQSPASEE